MDTTRDIITRGFKLNDASIRDGIDPDTGIGKGISGSVIDSWDFSDVDVVQFLEKRSQSDGMDAGDVSLGARRLRMAGTLYDKTRNLLFDAHWEMRKALSPVLAQREEPADKGYRPLTFYTPTNRQADYPEGVIPLQVYALPRALQMVWQRDQQGGDDSEALAIPWQATFLMRDPTAYSQTPVDVPFTTSVSGDFSNRGTYISPLNMLFVVDSASGSIVVTAGGSTFTITVPASTGSRTIRYKGKDKLLTVEENSDEETRMDLFTSTMLQAHPLIPEGTSPYIVTVSGVTLSSGTHMWFDEAYA